MRMSADKKFWRTRHQTADYRRVILPRITADMLYQHLRAIHREAVHLRKQLPDFLPVYISIDRPERPERRQLLRNFH